MVKARTKKRDFLNIKLLVLDFDGVLTDNRVYTDASGSEMVSSSRSDGLGIEMLLQKGIDVLVISREDNAVVGARCKKLRIRAIQSVVNKLEVLKAEIKKRRLSFSQVCFVGNDVNDIECLRAAGIGCAVADAAAAAIQAARYVTRHRGGNGAVREICDLILESTHWRYPYRPTIS